MVKRQQTTIDDVANASGVSTGTVSRVLNDRPGVHPDTRRAVMAAIEDLGYSPNRAARELSLGRTTVGLSVSHGDRTLAPYITLFTEHLTRALGDEGFRVERIPTHPNGLPTEYRNAMVLHGVREDDPRLAAMHERSIPFVVVGRIDGARWVAPDDRRGGRLAVEHLLNLGHERIVYVSGEPHHQVFFDRMQGARDALAAGGPEGARDLLATVACDGLTLGAYRAVRAAWPSLDGATAVFAASDEIAVGVIAALEDHGVSVPAEVSVVGYDDLPEVGEDLTTVHQDVAQLASITARLVEEAVRGEPVRHELLPVHLIPRGTTARRR